MGPGVGGPRSWRRRLPVGLLGNRRREVTVTRYQQTTQEQLSQKNLGVGDASIPGNWSLTLTSVPGDTVRGGFILKLSLILQLSPYGLH